MEAKVNKHCIDCANFQRGYRLQGMKVPDFCKKHFHSQRHDDPACESFAEQTDGATQ